MINERAKVDYRGMHRNRTYLFPDARKGLGYGQISSTGFNEPRISSSTYPYTEPDYHEDDEDDLAFGEDELDRFVKKINIGYTAVDALAKNKTDPFYYVAGNTPGLGGVSESGMPFAKNSIVPFPGWTKKIQAVSGGSSVNPSFTPSSALRTGTEQGYAHRPPQTAVALEDDEAELVAYRLQDILSDDELAMAKAEKIRQKIRRMISAEDKD